MLSRFSPKLRKYLAGAALSAALIAPVLIPGTAQAWWARGGWGWGLGVGVAVAPPVLVVPAPVIAYAASPPPVVVVPPPPPPPPPYAHWVPGHYNWQGYWIAGHWA